MVGAALAGALDYYRFPESGDGWGGPFSGQVFRHQIFRELAGRLSFGSIVETGTHRGSTTGFLHEVSRLPVLTVEADRRNYGFSRARFLWNRAIHVVHGDSRAILEDSAVLAPGEKTVFFYLDA